MMGGMGGGLGIGIVFSLDTPPQAFLGPPIFRVGYVTLTSTIGGIAIAYPLPYYATQGYNHGETVTLVASPIVGYHFVGWSGDFVSNLNPATFSMTVDESLEFPPNLHILATFAPNVFLTVYDFGADAAGWVFTPTNTQIFQGNCTGLWGGGKLNMTPLGGWGGGTWYYDFASHNEFFVMGDIAKIVVSDLVDSSWQKLGVNVGGALVNPVSATTYNLDPYYMGKSIERLIWDEMSTIPCSITKVTTSGFFGGRSSSNNGKLNWETAQYISQIPGDDGYSIGVNQLRERSYGNDRWVRYRLADSGAYGEGQIIVNATVTSVTGAINPTLQLRGGGADPITGTTVAQAYAAGDVVVLSGTTRTYNSGGSFDIWSSNNNNVGSAVTQVYINTVEWNDGILHNIYNAANDQSPLIPVDLFYLYTYVTLSGGSVGRDPNRVKYVAGSTVDLTGVPTNPGYFFTVWSGDLSGATNPATLTFPGSIEGPGHTSTQTVTANFGRYEYTFNVTVVGTGSIVQSPTPAIYRYGDIITLTATPGAGFALTGWSGDATGTTNPKNVTVVGNTNITGTFSINPYTTVWDFTAGAEGWVFTDEDGTSGTAPGDSRLHITNDLGGWRVGRWKYTYNTMSGLKTMMYDSGATVVASDYDNPANTNHKIGINIPGVGEYVVDFPTYTPAAALIGYPVDTFTYYVQNNGAGNATYLGKVVVSGFFEGEAKTALTDYVAWTKPLYVTQIPDIYGKGKLNYFRTRNVDWDTYIRWTLNKTIVGATTGYIKTTITCLESTASSYEQLKYRTTTGAHSLSNDNGFTRVHKGDTITLSGQAGQTYYSDGTFEIWSEASAYKNGSYGNFYISKIEWVDASIGTVTILDRPL